MTMTTLTTSHHDAVRGCGVLCQRLSPTNGQKLSTKTVRIRYDFYGQETKEFPKTYLMTDDLNQVNFSTSVHPSGLEDAELGFCVFAAKRKENQADFWQVLLPSEKIDQIMKNSDSGLKMQIFSICFDSSLQRMPLVITPKKSADENKEITFRTEYDAYMGYGLIEGHFSMTIEEYKSATGYDVILEYAKDGYYNCLLNGAFTEEYTFDEYYKRQKDHFGVV
jgi:hypothetical protein